MKIILKAVAAGALLITVGHSVAVAKGGKDDPERQQEREQILREARERNANSNQPSLFELLFGSSEDNARQGTAKKSTSTK